MMAKIKPVEEWTRSDREAARAILLEPSPYAVDGGELIGRDPRTISVEEFQQAGIDGVAILAVIRAKCLDCVVHQPDEVRKCVAVACPNWPYRMASNPFHKRDFSDEQRAAMSERAKINLKRRRGGAETNEGVVAESGQPVAKG
jgi:hypothetical protein